MKKILLIIILVISLSISSCTSNTTAFNQSSHEYGYLSSLKYMLNSYPSSFNDISVLSFDYTGINIDETELVLFKSLVQEFCEEINKTYLEATIDELIEMEYVETYELKDGTFIPNAFPNGALIQMTTVSTEENIITAGMSIWRGSLSAYGSTYTATFNDGSWEVSADGFWIS